MPINTKESYIEIGIGVNGDGTLKNPLQLPAPVDLPATNEFLVDTWRNANGSAVIQQVGRTQYKTEIKWARLDNKKWWEINRWFEQYGYVFYMRYFSHTEGRVKIHRFYRGNQTQATPSSTTEVMNGYTVPTHYYGCGFSIIDTGEKSVIIETEMAVD
jgi:hypothetical protein